MHIYIVHVYVLGIWMGLIYDIYVDVMAMPSKWNGIVAVGWGMFPCVCFISSQQRRPR